MGKKRKHGEMEKMDDREIVNGFYPNGAEGDEFSTLNGDKKHKKKKKHRNREEDEEIFEDSDAPTSSGRCSPPSKRLRFDDDYLTVEEQAALEDSDDEPPARQPMKWLVHKPLTMSLQQLQSGLSLPMRRLKKGQVSIQHLDITGHEGRVEKYEIRYQRAPTQLVHVPLPLDSHEKIRPKALIDGVVTIQRREHLELDDDDTAMLNLRAIKKKPAKLGAQPERVKAFGARVMKSKEKRTLPDLTYLPPLP